MDRGIFFALLYFSALVVVVGLMLLLLWPFLGAVAWAAVLAMASQPLHRVLASRFPKRKNLNAVLTTSAVVLTVAVPLIILAVLFAGESVQVVAAIEKAVTQGKIPGREQVMANPHVAYWVNKLQPYFIGVDIKEAAIAGLKAASSVGVAFSKTIMKHTLSMVLKFFVMVLVLFFAVRDGEGIISGFWSVIPLKARDKMIITQTVRRVINAVLYGIVLTCVLQGILGGIGFAIVGLPSPAFFGAAMIVAAFIPVVGTALVWVPAVLYLVAAGQYTQAVILLVWCLVVVASIDNVVRPFLIGERSKLPLIAIVLGVLGGLITLGFLGIILGPIMFAVALELFRIYRDDLFPSWSTPAPDNGGGD